MPSSNTGKFVRMHTAKA